MIISYFIWFLLKIRCASTNCSLGIVTRIWITSSSRDILGWDFFRNSIEENVFYGTVFFCVNDRSGKFFVILLFWRYSCTYYWPYLAFLSVFLYMIFFFSERVCTANSFDIRNIVQTKYHNLDAFLEPSYLSVHHLRCAFVILCEVQTQFKLLNKKDFHLEVRYELFQCMIGF